MSDEKLTLDLHTRDRINTKIYRFGFESNTLLIIGVILLMIGAISFIVMRWFAIIVIMVEVIGFKMASNRVKKEIEKGNLKPIESFLEAMSVPKEVEDDDVIGMLLQKRRKLDEQTQSTTTH